ncbi:MAG: gliding motility-associated C-terminal domain-containing protein, partial [Bacteroidia bacterium]
TYRIVIIEPDWAFFVPNAFSPNGDGINDTFGGNGYGVLEYQMLIFNRWGDRIFDTDSMEKPWTGKANLGNTEAQIDVYIYKIAIKDAQKKKHEYTGTVTLVR